LRLQRLHPSRHPATILSCFGCAETIRLRAGADAIGEEAASLPDGITGEEDEEQRYSLADHEGFVAVRDVADAPTRILAGVRAKAAVMLSVISRSWSSWGTATRSTVWQSAMSARIEDRMALSLARGIIALEIVA
jgi:hypothetical protein